jgi:hypothetical protein
LQVERCACSSRKQEETKCGHVGIKTIDLCDASLRGDIDKSFFTFNDTCLKSLRPDQNIHAFLLCRPNDPRS